MIISSGTSVPPELDKVPTSPTLLNTVLLRPSRHQQKLPFQAQISSSMTSVFPSSKRADATMESIVENPVEKSAFLRLPREIRDMIYDLLFVRPTGIVPWIYTGRPKKPIPYAVQGKPHNDGKHYSFDDVRNSYTRTSPGKVLLDVTWTTPVTLQEISQLSTLEKEPGCTIIPNGSLLNDCRDDQMKRLLHTRYDGAYEIIRSVPVMVEIIHGVALLATCKMLNAEGSQALYGKNLFVFNRISNIRMRQGADVFVIRENLAPLPSNIPEICRPDEEISVALQRLFTEYTLYDKEPGACRQDRKLAKFVRQDAFLTFLNRIGMKNASLLTNLNTEDDWYCGHPTRKSRPFLAGPYTQFNIGDRLRIYTTIFKALGCKIENLILHNSRASRDRDYINYDGRSRTLIDEDMEGSVGLLVNALPTLKTLQLGRYTFETKLRYIDEWRKCVRWSAFVRQRAVENHSQRVPRGIEEIIENIHRDADAYYSKIISLFETLPFTSDAWDEFESRYTPRMKSGSDQRTNRMCQKENWKLLNLGHSECRRWMGFQYPRYDFNDSMVGLMPKRSQKSPMSLSSDTGTRGMEWWMKLAN
ncbi:hypothetical protein HYALB_00000492 [Hymenoscyphus albidus]|uniref:Uncharacterized protein n=1 Tax=Hymenoscyphus albidus TaxID=595503 RepID=A0A9N9LL09_9HELO|nr:hypothetical protein HYALB_00000492 [Hymenoscyphus albidus]